MAKSVFVEKKRQWEKTCVPVLIIRVGLSFSMLVSYMIGRGFESKLKS